MENLTVDQGSQRHVGRVRVGVMRAGIKKGVPTVRLSLRSPDHQQIVDLAQGQTALVPGEGSITVTGVHRRSSADGRESVELAWSRKVRPSRRTSTTRRAQCEVSHRR